MTALSSDRDTPSRAGDLFVLSVAADVCCYAGAIAVRDSSGNVKPGVTGTGLVALGRFAKRANNTGGLAGAIDAQVEPGTFRFGNSSSTDAITAAEIGSVCYIVDDCTVAKTSGSSTRSPAGIVADVDSAGVWARMGFEALVQPATALLAASNLSDLASASAARGNLGGGANKMPIALGALSSKGADAAVVRYVSPVAGTIAKGYSVLNGALATGDATFALAINGTAITNGTITATQSGSAAGDVDSCTPTAANTVAVGDVISITGGGSSTATATASVSILITPTA